MLVNSAAPGLPSRSAVAHRHTAPPHSLLSTLPRSERSRLVAGCERVELAAASVLYVAGDRVRHVYFPIDSQIALVASEGDRAILGVAMVGDEGMIGISLLLGMQTAPWRALVQGSGSAWRIDAAAFARELIRSPALARGLNRYVLVLLIQLAQAVACTRFHLLEARLARWLLTSRDRSHVNEFRMTHAFLAGMLGVRRAGISRAASSLQGRHLIEYHRGLVRVLDDAGLEAAACPCYAADRATWLRLLG
jgi:CRP-like cAMP-binding protein